MSKNTPAPPDYTGAAREQAQASRDLTDVQTWSNRPTQNTPWGTTTWDTYARTDPASGTPITQWTQNTTLTPELQRALDAQLALQEGRSNLAQRQFGRSADEMAPEVDFGAMPDRAENLSPTNVSMSGSTPFAFAPNSASLQGVSSAEKYRKDAGDAIYNQFSDRNEPIFARDRERQRTQLYNQGLKEGDAAYEDQMRTFDQGVNDARTNAAYQATIGSGAEAQRMFGMDSSLRGQQFQEGMSGAGLNNSVRTQQFNEQLAAGNQNFNQQLAAGNFANQNRQQAIAELLQQRGWSLNEANALLTGQQVGMPSMPSFNTAQRSETPQLLQAAQMGFNSQMDAFNAQQAAAQGLMSGAMGAFAMSDRRLKRNVRRVGTVAGHPWYEFEYVWGEKSQGVMADEVPARYTARHSSGYMMVNYGALLNGL